MQRAIASALAAVNQTYAFKENFLGRSQTIWHVQVWDAPGAVRAAYLAHLAACTQGFRPQHRRQVCFRQVRPETGATTTYHSIFRVLTVSFTGHSDSWRNAHVLALLFFCFCTLKDNLQLTNLPFYAGDERIVQWMMS